MAESPLACPSYCPLSLLNLEHGKHLKRKHTKGSFELKSRGEFSVRCLPKCETLAAHMGVRQNELEVT